MGSVSLLLGRKCDEQSGGTFDDLDSLDLKTVVKDNVHVGPDNAVVVWEDYDFRDLHVHSNPNVTTSTRCVTFSNDLAFSM
jgi:hypothetical protein